MTNKDILNKYLSKKKSTWREDAQWRKENDYWIETSQRIAIKILLELRERKISKTEFALVLGVSPQQVNTILKGKENLTIKTIIKIEIALGIELISVVDSSFKLTSAEIAGRIENASKITERISDKKEAIKVPLPVGLKTAIEGNSYAMAA